MLSSPDTDLVRRDPALPGLGTVLDPVRLAGALRAARPALGIDAVQVGYVHYKPGRECLVGYRLPRAERAPEPSDARTLRGTIDLYAVAQRRERWERNQRAEGHAPNDGRRRVALAGEAVTVALFPDDAKLDTLGCLLDADARTRLLRDLLPGRPDLRAGPLGTLAYKPQRRWVGRLLGPDGPLALKVCAAKDYAATVATARALRSRGLLRIPRVLGCSEPHRLLAFEWLAGDRLSDLVVERGRTGGEPPRAAAALVGTALAALHAQPAESLPRLARAEEVRRLCALAEELAHTYPPLGERAAVLAQRLAVRLRDLPAVECAIHGDFYAKQVLLDGRRVGIIDLDQAARGDPAFDLGRFIAHLERGALRDGLPARHVGDLTRAFLEGYQVVTGGPAPERVGLYVAVGLFLMLRDPFRYHQPDWPEQTAAILARAEAVLGGRISEAPAAH
jgi:aminoglycoside phosphotransferase (APT) family kinase protein